MARDVLPQTLLARQRLGAGLVALLAMAGCASPPAPDADALLRRADQALGASGLQTLQFSASGTGGVFGQAVAPDGAWPTMNYTHLARSFDYGNNAMREDFTRSRPQPPGVATSDQRMTTFARDQWAWGAAGPQSVAMPAWLDQRVHDLWTSPHGILIAARRHGARAGSRSEDGKRFDTLSYAVPGQLRVTAWLDEAGRIVRADSTLPNPVLGDTEVVTRYSEYQPAGGIQFPMRIQQSQGGHAAFDLQVLQVQANPALDISVPDTVRNFTERVTAEEMGEGVWFLGGGSHNSVLVEMSTHAVLIEAPLSEARTLAVFAEARRLLPGKPITTVVNTHHHFDHAGGLRAAVAQGATLITSRLTQPYLTKVLAQPNTVAPDALARSGRQAELRGVDEHLRLADGKNRIDIHEIRGSAHAQGFLMIHLPQQKLLIQGDAYNPGPPNAPVPARPSDSNVNLVQNIERLNLQVERLLPLHGRVVPYSELLRVIGR